MTADAALELAAQLQQGDDPPLNVTIERRMDDPASPLACNVTVKWHDEIGDSRIRGAPSSTGQSASPRTAVSATPSDGARPARSADSDALHLALNGPQSRSTTGMEGWRHFPLIPAYEVGGNLQGPRNAHSGGWPRRAALL